MESENVDLVKWSKLKRMVLLVSTLGCFLTPFMGSAINIALPAIGKEFEISPVMLNWIATVYLLSAGIFMIPSGVMADRYGRKKTFSYGILVFTISSFACGVSPNLPILILSRIAQGISGAMIMATGVAILTSVFSERERGKAIGINTSAVYAGLSSGPVVGGILTQHLGWRSVFLVNVPLGLLVVILIFLKLNMEWKEPTKKRVDLPGFLLYSVSLLLIMVGAGNLLEWWGKTAMFLGVISLIVFILVESKIESPMININLFKSNTVFALSNLSALINYSATFGVGFLLSLHLQYANGLNPQSAGIILLTQPIIMAMFSPFAGKLSDKIEPQVVASGGMALNTISLGYFAFINDSTSISLIVSNLILLGIGFALFSSPNTNAVMSSVSRQFYGTASGTLGTMRVVGQMLSMGIIMVITAMVLGKTKITQENLLQFLKSEQITFTIFAILSFIGIFTSLARGKLRKKL